MSPRDPAPSPFSSASEREAARVAKREALLLAAARMFNERGFHATSLDDVATSLGVTKPVIYYYLGAKDQVLLECMRIGLVGLQEAADWAIKDGGPGLRQLERFLVRYGEIIMGDFGRCVIRAGDEGLSLDGRIELRRMKRQIDERLRQFLQIGMEDGSICRSDVRLTAFTIAGALNWSARWQNPKGPLSATESARGIVALLVAGLSADPGR